MLKGLRKFFAPAPAAPAFDWRRLGNEALGRGDLRAAASAYLEGTRPTPGAPLAWLNLGFVQLEMGDHEAARNSLRRAEDLLDADAPELADVWALMGRERQESRDWAAAESAYRRVVERQPLHELAWRELGQVLELQGALAEAETAYMRAIAIRGDFELVLRDVARLLLRLGRDREALSFIERCLRLPDVHPETYLMHASALGQVWRLPEALEATDRALAQGYDETLMVIRGKMLTTLKRTQEALDSHAEVLRRNPHCVEAMTDSARALILQARYDDALALLDRADALRPGQIDIVGNKIAALLGQLRCREALELIDNDLSAEDAKHPEIEFLASFMALLLGDFERGWVGYEARWKLQHRGVHNRKPDYAAPDWRGQPLADKSIVLYYEQGLGDSIQALRYLPLVAENARKVWLRVQRPLWSVLPELPPNCELLGEGAPAPKVDFACPLMGLPAAFRTRVNNIPARVPYLQVPSDRLEHWRRRLGPRTRALRVGLVWSGNPDQVNDHNRSMPLATMRSAAPDGVEYISLQKEIRPTDEAALHAWPELRFFGPELQDFGDTAALASLVDVVVSVCTSVAHLAGALGRPLSVVLTYGADWRWLLDRDDSPWYPTAKLYRQQTPGDWGPPLTRVMAELEERAALTSPASA